MNWKLLNPFSWLFIVITLPLFLLVSGIKEAREAYSDLIYEIFY